MPRDKINLIDFALSGFLTNSAFLRRCCVDQVRIVHAVPCQARGPEKTFMASGLCPAISATGLPDQVGQ